MECNGKAKALPSAIKFNFVGLRFREFCLSVMVHRDENGSQQEGFYFAAAWNSSRVFAVIERPCFSTPYRYGNVYAEPAEARVSPASPRLAHPTKEPLWDTLGRTMPMEVWRDPARLCRPQLQGSRRRSLTLYHGVLGRRTKHAGVVIGDDAAALAWAQEHLPEAVQPRADKKALEGALKETGKVVA